MTTKVTLEDVILTTAGLAVGCVGGGIYAEMAMHQAGFNNPMYQSLAIIGGAFIGVSVGSMFGSGIAQLYTATIKQELSDE